MEGLTMRAIDADEAMIKIVSLVRLARSDQQKALLGRCIYIIEHCKTVGENAHENKTNGGIKGEVV